MEKTATRHFFQGKNRVWAALGAIVMIASANRAWADIPTCSVRTTKEGCKAKLEASLRYHETWLPDCRLRVYRISLPSKREKLIFDDDAGELSFDCTCGVAPFGPRPAPGVEGKSCTPPATCGDPNAWCYCTRTCMPLYDAPGMGSVRYRVETDQDFQGFPVFDEVGPLSFDAECGPPNGDGDSGCSTVSGPAAPASWLAVLALLVVGIVFGRFGRRR